MSLSYTDSTQINLHKSPEEVPILRTAYGPKLRVSLHCDHKLDLTSQEFKEECDINTLMAKFKDPQLIPFQNRHQPQYGDFTGYEFNEMQDKIVEARNMFADLPAKVRDRFNNDPAKFLDFFNDPENAQEAAKMGLLAPKKEEPIPTPTPEPKKAPEGSKEPAPKAD